MSDHPIRLAIDDDLRRSRVTVFFRLLLAIPLFVWLILWTIAGAFAAIGGWFVALATGRLPGGIHNFLSGYVRFLTQFYAYLSIAANPFPGFTGEPGYPVDIQIPEPQRQSRWKVAFRLVLAIPALLLAAVLGSGVGGGGVGSNSGAEWATTSVVGGVAAFCGLLGWFAALATGRMPLGLRNLAAYGLGYSAQASAYALLLTDRYPNSDPKELGPVWQLRPHPVRLELADDGSRSRLTVFFRLLLAIPHFVWLALWSVVAILAALANGLIALLRGRSAEPLHRFLGAYVRYSAHLTAFVALIANPFPGFTGAPGYPVDIVVGAAERQNRWITLFRMFLVIPALILSSVLTGVLVVIGFLGWFASLATGRMPTGLRHLGAVGVRYLAQTNAYWFVLTDAYPFASPALHPPEPEADVHAVAEAA